MAPEIRVGLTAVTSVHVVQRPFEGKPMRC